MQIALRRTVRALSVALVVLALAGGCCFSSAVPRAARMFGASAPHDRARTRVALLAGSNDDAIGRAAAELSKAAYPFMTQVDWNDPTFWMVPGGDAISWTKATAKIIDHGVAMDADLVKAGCEAHHAAIKGLPSNGVCSEEELTAINAAIGRMIASVPESKTMDVYNTVSALVDSKVPAYLMSKVNEADAKKAYEALVKFTEVVKANPITPSTPATTVSSEAASSIDAAASNLGKAAYPFMKQVDWSDDLYGTTVPGSSKKTLDAIDKMLVMGMQMDSAALKDAAMAHVKAIEGMDAKGVMTEADFEAILAGIGKTVASVPAGSVMDVYNAIGGLASPVGIPQYVLSKQNPAEAMGAYGAFMDFKDTVREAQKKDRPADEWTMSANQNAVLISVIIFINVVGTALIR